MTNQREPTIICGRTIGTSDGWDLQDTNVITLYDFVPNEAGKAAGLSQGDLTVDYDNGLLSNDECGWEADLITILAGLPWSKHD